MESLTRRRCSHDVIPPRIIWPGIGRSAAFLVLRLRVSMVGAAVGFVEKKRFEAERERRSKPRLSVSPSRPGRILFLAGARHLLLNLDRDRKR